jgi:hypothetical protein
MGAKREKWVVMRLSHLGDVQTLIHGGGGKLSTPTNDSGDIRKPKGSE